MIRFVPMAARPMVRGSDVIVNIVNYVVKKRNLGTFSTLFKIKVFRFIDKVDVYYRRHFLKAEQQSGQLRHHVITTDQSGVFPKIASQS